MSVHKQSIVLFLVISLCLLGCFNSDNPPPLNGGYSWWSGPYVANVPQTNNQFYITGTNRKGSKGQQWVAQIEVSESQVEVIQRVNLNTMFKHDEHNAPAVINTPNQHIIIAATGHANVDNESKNRVIVYHGNDLNSLVEHELLTPHNVTYVQLLLLGNRVVLFSRLSEGGFHYSYTQDDGKSWSPWRPFIQSSYVKLTPDANHQALTAFIGSHPGSSQNKVSYTTASFNPVTEQFGIGPLKRPYINANELQAVYSPEQNKATRILDAKSNALAGYALISQHNITNSNDTWDLLLMKVENDEVTTFSIKNNLKGVLGKRNHPLNTGFYVLGASILNIGHSDIQLVIASKTEEDYTITRLRYDLQAGNVTEEDTIYTSNSTLYRPIVFIGENNQAYVMFNEASFWNTYIDWVAEQKIVPLG